MSRVFLATEHTLGRKIVVKVLPPDTVAQVSIERFKREIRLAASLQHPHIVPLLAAGDSDGLPYYTMPFVRGESLRERLLKGELSIKDTLHVLRDVASALAYAHAEGIVHRDIKPENVMLSGGVAVVTDFGVSKAVNVATDAGTTHAGLTSLGVALGTPAYMSPEQASADPHIDHRADIYSFGCVAYEMLTGASPFAGRPPQQMLAAHVTEVPTSVAKRRPNTPPALAALVSKCLEKRPGDRPQSAEELLAGLDAISTPSGGTEPTTVEPARVRSRRVWGRVATGLVVAAILAAALWWRSTSFVHLHVGATITPVAVTPAVEMDPAISPDGKLVAYMGATAEGARIFVRQIDGDRATMISGDLADADQTGPRWSPDGSRLFFATRQAVYVIPALGGTPKRLFSVDLGPEAATWFGEYAAAPSPDGRSIAYADLTRGIWLRSIDGGEPRLLVPGEYFSMPAWSRDGRLAFVKGRTPTLRNISTTSVWVLPAGSGAPVRISDSVHVNTSPVWSPDGKSVLYISTRGGGFDVYQQRVSRNGLPAGEPLRLTTNLGAYHISLAGDGARMAYDVVRNKSNIWTASAADGGAVSMASAKAITTDNQRVESMSLSHDGHWLAYDSNRDGNYDLYKIRLDGGQAIRLTNTPNNEFRPVWSIDDREIAFHSARAATRDIFVMNADGGSEKPVTSGAREDFVGAWSPDGQSISFTGSTPDGATDLYVTHRGDDARWSEPRRLTRPAARLQGFRSAWSPDGRWLTAADVNAGLALVSSDGRSTKTLGDSATFHGPVVATEWPRDPNLLFASTWTPTYTAIWAVPLDGRPPHIVVQGDAAHQLSRPEFATNGREFFFTLADNESDVFVVDLKR